MPGAPPLAHPSQPTFSSGELSPEMYSRIDLAKYSTGLRTGRNVFVRPQGGVSNRSGLRMVAQAKYPYATHSCRMIPFDVSDTQSYMLEVGHQYIRCYVNGAQIQMVGAAGWVTGTVYAAGNFVTQSGIQYYCLLPHMSGTFATDLAAGRWIAQNIFEIPTPYDSADLPLIKYVQSASNLYLAHPNYAPMTLIRTTDTNWTLAAFPFANGPFMDENATAITITPSVPANTLTASAPLFNANHLSSLWKVNARVPAQYRSTNFSATLTNYIDPISVSSAHDFNISTSGTWTGSFKIQRTTDGGVTWLDTSQVFSSSSDANFNVNGDAAEMCLLRIFVISVTAGTLKITLSSNAFIIPVIYQVFSVPSSTVVGIALTVPSQIPFGIASNATGVVWTTTEWFEGAWSTYRGWPSAVTFYQDRLGWASTPANPLGSWWSQTGNYVDYGISDPLVDSDSISFNMPTRKLNQCQHLLPMFQVLALTSSGEISIGAGGSGDFTPTSLSVLPQTYHGAAPCPPVLINNEAVFIQARSSQVRSIQYQYFTNIFNGEILNLMATHLFDGYSITDMCYAESPNSTIFTVRSDGILLCFTYLKEQQVLGWTHWDTNGSFESCAVIPNGTYDELWVVVNRPFGTFIERLAQRLPTTDTKDQFHVDCGIDYSGAPTTGISGLDYLEGQSVMVLGDGNVMGPFVVSSGSITLGKAVSLAHIGLSYTCDAESLNIELPSQDGTSQGRRQRVAAVTLRFVNSLGGKVGQVSTNLHAINPNPVLPHLATYMPLFSGDYPKIPLPGDWTNNGRWFFRQTDPLPFTLTGAFPIIEAGNI